MKKLIIPAVALAAALTLTGCIHPSPIDSPIIIDEVVSGSSFDNSVKMEKCGRSEAKHILIFATGDASIRAAMRESGITKIHHVDYKSTNVLGLYMHLETNVWGE